MVKKIVPVIALLAVLGGVYKFVLAKPAKAEPKPHVEGTVYMLQKEFLINLADGRFAKMQIGLVLAHDDTSTVAAGGHETSTPPEGYGSQVPIDTNSTAEGRARNRRVEIVLSRLHSSNTDTESTP